jgi:tetratricopeptide (TPR) repeat protein
MERARTVLEKALALSPDLARAHFFYAKVLRSDGNYDGAAAHLQKVLAQYPRDRVALNDLGRILFLQRKYKDAVQVLQRVMDVDPEDLQAHYDLMLCYRGLGDEKQAHEHEVRYLRFKADEASQTITGPYRQLNPEDNNERQAIHEHISVPLGADRAKSSSIAARHTGGISNARVGTGVLARPVERSSTRKNRVGEAASAVESERSSSGPGGLQ